MPWVSLTRTPAVHQPFADLPPGTQSGIDVDPGPETEAAHGGDAVPDQPAQLRVQALPQLGRALLVLAGLEHPDHTGPDGRRQRIPPEGRAVLTGVQHAEHVGVADHRRHRHHTAPECLAQQVEVRHHPDVLGRERPTGPTETGLDLVADQQHLFAVQSSRSPGR